MTMPCHLEAYGSSPQGSPADLTIDAVVRVAFQYTRNMSAADWLSNEDFEGREELA